ncbi:MAG: hypothetical protein ABII74_03980 [Elusimicrobiota bacterium]
MNKKAKFIEKFTKEKHFKEAKENFKQIQEEIEPFIKHRKFKVYTTEGKWQETSSLYS